MKGIKSVIWSNYNHNLEDWEDYLEDAYPEVTDEYEKYHIIEEANNRLLEDEIDNLDYPLPTEIIIIGNLGLWDGRVPCAYKETKYKNLKDCLRFEDGCDYAAWYIDDKNNLRGKQSHHDGTNYYLYRMWKENLSDTQKENFLNKIFNRQVTSKDITRYTKSLGKIVCKIYGIK